MPFPNNGSFSFVFKNKRNLFVIFSEFHMVDIQFIVAVLGERKWTQSPTKTSNVNPKAGKSSG